MSQRDMRPESSGDFSHVPVEDALYLNLALLNKPEAVETIVKERYPSDWLRRQAALLAGRMMKEERVTDAMVAKIKQLLPEKLQELGLQVAVTPVFRKGAYMVFRLVMEEIDTKQLLPQVKGAEFAHDFATMRECITRMRIPGADAFIDGKVREVVRSKLIEEMQRLLPQKLLEKGIQVDCRVLPSSHQAGYFFGALLEGCD